MKYYFALPFYFFVTVYCLVSIQLVSANWFPVNTLCTQDNATTIDPGTFIVPKLEGIFQYCAKQKVIENPYSGATITFDGVSYAISFPDGTSAVQSTSPNQAQFLGKYIVKSKIYKYDKTFTNTCLPGSAILYFGLPGATPPLIAYTGAWTNQDLFSRVNCTDREADNLIMTNSGNIVNVDSYTMSGSSVYSGTVYMTGYSLLPASTIDISGCEKPFYDTNAVYGFSGILLTLSDNAGNKNTNTCSYDGIPLKDANPPEISVIDPSGVNLLDFNDDYFQSGTLLATDSASFQVTIKDVISYGNAVSGIKNYSAKVFQIEDHSGNTINPELPVCDVPLATFPPLPVNASNIYNTTDTRLFSIDCTPTKPSLRKTGIYRIDISAEDHTNNVTNFKTRFIVYPNPDIHIVDKPIIPTPSPVNSDGVALHRFDAQVLDRFDNPVYDYPIDNIVYTGSPNIYINEVTRNGNAVFVKNTYPVMTSGTGLFSVYIASVAPGELPTGFGFNIKKWTTVTTFLSHVGNSLYYGFGDGTEIRKFRRPYTGILTLDPDRVVLGYVHTGSLTVTPASFATGTYQVRDFFESIVAVDPNMVLSYSSKLNSLQAIFTPEQVGNNILDFRVKTHPYAVYPMSGILVHSYITPNDTDIRTTSIISVSNGAVNRIHIIGNKHSTGKEDYVSSILDIGVPSAIDIKNIIRKNATVAVRARTPDIATSSTPKIVNGIKYITGDYTLGDTEASSRNWETLVVIDGNVTVETEKFNTNGKIVAIIVMRSDPNGDKGNLFIKPNVRYISSLIYTDGSIESVDNLGARFLDMSKTRSTLLSNQLVLKGVFISRNTIGGAVRGSNASGAGGKRYSLPGNIGTDDLLLAARFDLSFLRSYNNGFDNPSFTQPYNLGNNAFTVVIHDPNYLQSPPPGFSIQP